MIVLRKLKLKDIPYMLEWMHDEETNTMFQNDFISVDEEQAKKFIECSFTLENKHFAIVDDVYDEYLGTISLKNIDYKHKNAEYAISTRKKARGTGQNLVATRLLIKYAFDELKLHKIYLNVLANNKRAIKFYLKSGFSYEGTFKEHLYINGVYCDLDWYGVTNEQV